MLPMILINHQRWKLKSPSAKDQAAGVNKSGPHKHYYGEDFIWPVHNKSILAATK